MSEIRKFNKQNMAPGSDVSKIMSSSFEGMRGILFRSLENVYRIIFGLQIELEQLLNGDIRTELGKHLFGSKSWSPGAINDAASASTTLTVTGATAGSPAFAGFTGLSSINWEIHAIVTATDTVSVRIVNRTGSPVTPTGTLYVDVWTH
jgi:hypothetical protein